MTWEYANFGDNTIAEIGLKILHESVASKQVKYTCNRFQNLQHQGRAIGLVRDRKETGWRLWLSQLTPT